MASSDPSLPSAAAGSCAPSVQIVESTDRMVGADGVSRCYHKATVPLCPGGVDNTSTIVISKPG